MRITGERFYKRGYDYYKKGRVHGLTYNPSINTWRGTVRGTETYSVRLFFFDNDDLEGSCDCPAYATHYTCKHIAAVLLAVSQESWNKIGSETESREPLTNHNFDLSSRMIKAFSREEASQKQLIRMEYFLKGGVNTYNSKFFLEIEVKLGPATSKRTYVIKNIRELLSYIRQEKAYEVTPSFTLQPGSHIFTPEDKEVIDILIDAHQNEFLYETSFGNPSLDKRTIMLPPKTADQILPKLSELESYHHIKNDKPQPFHVETEGPDLSFDLETQESDSETFQINLSELGKYSYFDSYGYLFAEDTFYFLNSGQQAVMNQIYPLLPYRTEQKQQIRKKEMESFITHVVPNLEKLGKVNYSKSTRDHVTITPLKPKIYLDEVNDSLQLKLEFHYGNDVFYPYQKDGLATRVVKREAHKELKLIGMVEKAEFVFLNQMYQLFKNEAIYRFLHETLPELEKVAELYVSGRVKAMISEKQTSLTSAIQVNEASGMLDITFDIAGISPRDIDQLLQALIEKKKYFRIPEGALVSLEGEEFESFRQLSEKLHLQKSEVADGNLHVPMARSLQVEDALQVNDNTFSESFQHLLDQLKNPGNLDFPLPEGLNAELRDYQLVGYQWFKTLGHYYLGGILADDMGLGKTIQTIAYLLSEKENNPNGQNLVVAPASLLYNWKKEFEKFAPSLGVAVIAGNKQQRKQQIQTNSDADVLITSYPLLRKDAEEYQTCSFENMILDEAQAIKNHLTLTAKAARAVPSKKRFALSGTPIENSLEELWAIFYTISPGLFHNKKSFLTLKHDYIAKITRPFILRRIKKDVLDELPDKIESVQYSDLTKEQKEVYLAYLGKMQQQVAETIEEKGFDRGKLEILAGLTRLRQICCHPALFLENYRGKSGKLEQLLQLADELKANGKRALIFSQFSSMLGILNNKLQEEGFDTFYLDGSTPSLERMEMSERFNNGEKGIFLISLKAGGTGLNLTGADTVILYDLWWNPAIEEQAAGRAHRIGQKNVVQVVRLITEGTIEEKIFELQQKKRELVDQIIQPGETMLSKLSEQEIRELLEMKV